MAIPPAPGPLRLFRSSPARLLLVSHYYRPALPPAAEVKERWRLRIHNRIPEPEGPLPYFVPRTKNGNFPVYQEIKAGGNKHQTRIRMVEGNLKYLAKQLEAALELDKGNVTFKQYTGQVLIKGRERSRVLEFLEYSRF